MKRIYYNIPYAIVMIAAVITFIVVKLSDSAQMLIGIVVIILTSIFTYTNRYAILRKNRSRHDS